MYPIVESFALKIEQMFIRGMVFPCSCSVQNAVQCHSLLMATSIVQITNVATAVLLEK